MCDVELENMSLVEDLPYEDKNVDINWKICIIEIIKM